MLATPYTDIHVATVWCHMQHPSLCLSLCRIDSVRMSKKKLGLHRRRYRDASYLIRDRVLLMMFFFSKLKHLNLERKSRQVGQILCLQIRLMRDWKLCRSYSLNLWRLIAGYSETSCASWSTGIVSLQAKHWLYRMAFCVVVTVLVVTN
jgi:hypothetical protein